MPAQEIQIGGEGDDSGEGRFYAGDEEDLEFPMEDENGDDLDLDAANAVEFYVYDTETAASDTSNAVISKTRSGGDVTTLDSDSNGVSETAVVSFDKADTDSLVSSTVRRLYFELWVEDSNGDLQTMYAGELIIDGSGK